MNLGVLSFNTSCTKKYDLQIFRFLPLKMKFWVFRKKELKSLILDKFYIINGNICIYCKEAVKYVRRNKYEFMGYNNKFYKIYKKQIGLWMHSIFSNTKIKKYKVLRIIELWLIKAASGVIAYILRINKNTIYRILKKTVKNIS